MDINSTKQEETDLNETKTYKIMISFSYLNKITNVESHNNELLENIIHEFCFKTNNDINTIYFQYNDIIITPSKIELYKVINLEKNNKILINVYPYTILTFKYLSLPVNTTIKIFNELFVNNNKEYCRIIYDNIEYNLTPYFNIGNEIPTDNVEIIFDFKYMPTKINISYMFHGCSSILLLPDISQIDTSNITDMQYLFCDCQSLIELPNISKWNTSKVNNMSFIFSKCKSLTSIPDLSNWDMSNVKNMSYFFCNCENILNLPNISKWETNNVNNMSSFFAGCVSLLYLPDISKWNTKNVIKMNHMFSNCQKITSLPDISIWNTENIKDMRLMFFNCNSLMFLPDISKWNMTNVECFASMFCNCISLVSLPNIQKWNNKNIRNFYDLFPNSPLLPRQYFEQ